MNSDELYNEVNIVPHEATPDNPTLHGSAERVENPTSDMTNGNRENIGSSPDMGNDTGDEDESKIRYGLIHQLMKGHSQYFSNRESGRIDEWFQQLEFLCKPHKLTSKEKAYFLVNRLKDRAFQVVLSGDSEDYESLKQLLLKEFRVPGTYYSEIAKLATQSQRPGDQSYKYYKFLTDESRRVNDLAKERNDGQPNPVVSEDFMVAIFLNGLKNVELKKLTAGKEYTSIQEAYEDVAQIEQRLRSSGSPGQEGSDRKRKRGNGFHRPSGPPNKKFKPFSKKALKCYNCQKLGHMAKDCRSRVSAITMTNETFQYGKTGLDATVMANIGLISEKVLIDSGADLNCISKEMAVKAGIKAFQKVKGPSVTFASATTGKPLGMAEIKIKFHKDDDWTMMKFLVFEQLNPGIIIGCDGQDQLRVRIDWEQHLIWVQGKPIPIGRSKPDALVNLGSAKIAESFKDKIGKSKECDSYSSANTDALELNDELMQFQDNDGTYEEVHVDQGLGEQDSNKLRLLLRKHKDCFGYFERDGKQKSSVTTCVEHQIETDGTIARTAPYRVSAKQLDVIREEVDHMHRLGIIRESNSDYASPVVLVPKPDGTWRFCVDYRKLNSVTKSDSYPIPNVHDSLSKLHGAQIFAKIDLAAGYWQIPMHRSDIEKTAFVTPFGLYEYMVMPFGLKTAPATFQRMMDRVLRGISNTMVYLDDILVYAESFSELNVRLSQVLERLSQHNLKARAKKCFIGLTEIDYLGFKVGKLGIRADENKVEAIRKLAAPTNLRGLRRFLGMANYYRNFVQNFANIAKPLTSLLQAKRKWNWDGAQQSAFDEIKELLISAPVLAHPNPKLPFVIFTDASNYGVGAVLVQEGHPIWYASRTLSSAEVKYDTREKEVIAVMFGLDMFKPYYYGNRVSVMTDHGNLRWLMDHQQKGRLARWQLFLQQYDFDLHYVKGEHNPVADALSRDIDTNVRIAAITGLTNKRKQQVVVEIPMKGKDLFKDIKWAEEQLKDPIIMDDMEREPTRFKKTEDVVYRQMDNGLRLYIPDHIVDRAIKIAHGSNQAAHGGMQKTSYHLRHYWFPSFRKRIERYCRSCLTCAKAKGFADQFNELHTRATVKPLERV